MALFEERYRNHRLECISLIRKIREAVGAKYPPKTYRQAQTLRQFCKDLGQYLGQDDTLLLGDGEWGREFDEMMQSVSGEEHFAKFDLDEEEKPKGNILNLDEYRNKSTRSKSED